VEARRKRPIVPGSRRWNRQLWQAAGDETKVDYDALTAMVRREYPDFEMVKVGASDGRKE
jgi:hypothetical protein